jgi:hypothetical protein
MPGIPATQEMTVPGHSVQKVSAASSPSMCWAWWQATVIPATQEAQEGRLQSRAALGKDERPYPKTN